MHLLVIRSSNWKWNYLYPTTGFLSVYVHFYVFFIFYSLNGLTAFDIWCIVTFVMIAGVLWYSFNHAYACGLKYLNSEKRVYFFYISSNIFKTLFTPFPHFNRTYLFFQTIQRIRFKKSYRIHMDEWKKIVSFIIIQQLWKLKT